jgi:hypothetical protein
MKVSPVALIVGAVIIVCAIVATVVLILTGHSDASDLIVVLLATTVPLIFGAILNNKVEGVKQDVQNISNGGTTTTDHPVP